MNSACSSTLNVLSNISLLCSLFILGLGFIMAQFRIGLIFFSTCRVRQAQKSLKSAYRILSKLSPSKTQNYLVSVPPPLTHLHGMSCHSWAGSWPSVAPFCSTPEASLRYRFPVIHVLISLVHIVRQTAQTQVAGPIASAHLSELFKLPRARGAYNLFLLRERNGWSGSSHCRSDRHLDWTKKM